MRYAIDWALTHDSQKDDNPEPGFYVVDTQAKTSFDDVIARFLSHDHAEEYCDLMNAREGASKPSIADA